ncbi:HelD family protein, partial [Nonomuraea rubra]|uniref:HelD family protein n=1 Tax=Nonomuraea rubra TaxID=46180 RepID=UPI003CD072BD
RLGRHLKSLAKELSEEPEGPPFFGLLDFGPGSAEHAGRAYHIGRRHISGEPGGPPVVIDWRAPVSRAFYRASARDPQGVDVRRRFGWSGTTLTGFEDERLSRGEEGESRILAAEIERPRVGPMRDIVATIQPEQDDLVRAELDTSICVQGAPGTGKTAVGLHRAAYLLYAHRRRLQRAGVLVLGPNRAFLGYISAVLPALGEVDVEQTTLERLLATVPVTAVDGEATAEVKHDARMARVLRRALYGRIAKPVEPVAVPTAPSGGGCTRTSCAASWTTPGASPCPTAPAANASGHGWSSPSAARPRPAGRPPPRPGCAGSAAASPRGSTGSGRPPSRRRSCTSCCAAPHRTAATPARGLLTDAERAALTWSRPPRSVRSAKWSAADLVLLDELGALIERPRGYGHVIVDEAQDLSPMECRAVARRSEHGSLTVLGDLAQGTTPWAASSWPNVWSCSASPEARSSRSPPGSASRRPWWSWPTRCWRRWRWRCPRRARTAPTGGCG